MEIILLCCFAFLAGFVDSIVGGGGLIQMPALLFTLPQTALPVLFGTGKIPAITGTTAAAWQYSKKVNFNFKILATVAACALVAAYLGAQTINLLDSSLLKPLILIILVLIAVYTFFKKDLGSTQAREIPESKMLIMGSLIGLIIGFYDGFFGPGTGSFFILAFIMFLGFDFLNASAYAKIINCVTNLSALTAFIFNKQVLYHIALPMAVCNLAGGIIGSKLALTKGNEFIRKFFLIVICLLIARYAYDVFFK
ncbi:sulfite exporter TauE/SafE family protein [Solitalea lacus]|uniref:sulfite exporter TauE/SafE family protein n=1 Tax=Solitalea lacus TaxID=2911172 RepID=UPI001ED9DF19|nr:TSUP family transporter [Solitalea lacus]UKJ09169.1 TSUP family transporter [Solitalea lacus]